MQIIDTLTDDSSSPDESTAGFWRKQFSSEVTSAQSNFDIWLGVIAPIVCFIIDPIVFTDDFSLVPRELTRYKIFVYLFSALSILILLLILTRKVRSGPLNAVIAGILLSGALLSLTIGIMILPLSVLGLLAFIGILGFTPFVTAFVYLRNGVRAVNRAKQRLAPPQLTAVMVLSAVLVVVPCLLLQQQIKRSVTQSMNDLLRGDTQAAQSATKKLRYLGWTINLDEVVFAYSRETDATRKEFLANAYQEITGREIESRQTILLD
jgi:hypothetical protein